MKGVPSCFLLQLPSKLSTSWCRGKLTEATGPIFFHSFWGLQINLEWKQKMVFRSLYTQLNANYMSCVVFNWIENSFCFGSPLPPLYPCLVRKGQSSMAWMETWCHFGTCTHLAWQVVTGGWNGGGGETGVAWGASEHECTIPENKKKLELP